MKNNLSYSIMRFLISLLTLHFALCVNAQSTPDTNLFQWKFSSNFVSTALPSCDNLPITVEPVNATNVTHGIPPFYMIAWEIGGTPRTTLLGLNESSLVWTVDHPIGSTLMLNVVDSQGNGGGIPPQPYTVVSGHTAECVVGSNTTDFTVSANVSDTVNTCQPWGLRIKGGVPPYNVSFAQLNSPVVTNVSIPAGLDAFTYIDRATPGYLLLAAVSDATGRYAFGTPTVNPIGSEDVDCPGLNSVAGSSALLNQEQEAELSAIAAAKRKRTALLAGVLTPLFIILLGGVAFWAYRSYTKRQRIRKELAPEPLPFPEPKIVEEAINGMASVDRGTESRVDLLNYLSPSSASNSSQNPFMTEAELTASASASGTNGSDIITKRPHSGSSTEGRRGFTNFPTQSIRHKVSQKAIEAGMAGNQASPNSDSTPDAISGFERSRSAQAIGTTLSSSSLPVRSATFQGTFNQPLSGEGRPEYIFQHHDAGRIQVRELPPPYAERRSRAVPDVPHSP